MMINFLRKFRQQLLQENRIGRYLTYAIGEIILVMIGILLALQVNNWNEQRKKENTVAAYKKSLTEDLAKEILKTKSLIADSEAELIQLKELGDRISMNSLSFDSIVSIYRFEFDQVINASSEINFKILDGLIATGNINLLEEDLYNSLMALNDLQEKTIQEIKLNIDFFMIYSTRESLPFRDDWNALSGEPLERIWKNIDKTAFLRDFDATLSSKILVNKFIMEVRKKLLNETESVLKKLND